MQPSVAKCSWWHQWYQYPHRYWCIYMLDDSRLVLCCWKISQDGDTAALQAIINRPQWETNEWTGLMQLAGVFEWRSNGLTVLPRCSFPTCQFECQSGRTKMCWLFFLSLFLSFSLSFSPSLSLLLSLYRFSIHTFVANEQKTSGFDSEHLADQ